MNKEPTESEQRMLWEWCRARCQKCDKLIKVKPQRIQSDCCCYSFELDLDLNNLFKYAVPKMKLLHPELNLSIVFVWDRYKEHCLADITYYGSRTLGYSNNSKNPALALFWAIYSVIKEV